MSGPSGPPRSADEIVWLHGCLSEEVKNAVTAVNLSCGMRTMKLAVIQDDSVLRSTHACPFSLFLPIWHYGQACR